MGVCVCDGVRVCLAGWLAGWLAVCLSLSVSVCLYSCFYCTLLTIATGMLFAPQVGFDPAVMVSERTVADRNTALAFMCKGAGAFPDPDVDLQETIELYNATCSVTATTQMVSTAAATLANGGVNPFSGHAVFDPEVTRATLSLMLSCGMYDSSGEWAFDIGLPAKSSVSGVLMVVVPNGECCGVHAGGMCICALVWLCMWVVVI